MSLNDYLAYEGYRPPIFFLPTGFTGSVLVSKNLTLL